MLPATGHHPTTTRIHGPSRYIFACIVKRLNRNEERKKKQLHTSVMGLLLIYYTCDFNEKKKTKSNKGEVENLGQLLLGCSLSLSSGHGRPDSTGCGLLTTRQRPFHGEPHPERVTRRGTDRERTGAQKRT